MLRVGSVKFDPFFDLVVIGGTRWLEVSILTEVLLLGELYITHSKWLISQSDDCVNARVSNIIVC